MTADRIVEKAALLLGLTGLEEPRIQSHALNAVNRIYSEIYFLEKDGDFSEITDLSEPLDVSERVFYEVMPYGVASLLAAALGDTLNQRFYAETYNLKRKRAKNTSWQDTLPTV